MECKHQYISIVIDTDFKAKWKCQDCGEIVPDAIEVKVESPQGMSGWICPVCGAGLSPYTSVCPCYNQGSFYDTALGAGGEK